MSIFTEFKKFNRKYVIVTSMDDTALPADSEVLLEGVTVIYTATGEVKDASKCKVGDGSTTFGILPWIGARDVATEDLPNSCEHTSVARASTTMSVSANDTSDTITITASNNQGTGLVQGSNATASKTLTLTTSGKTATVSDGTYSISKDVTTATRAGTTLSIPAGTSTSFTATAENNQSTGYVIGSNQTATKTVYLRDNGAAIEAASATSGGTVYGIKEVTSGALSWSVSSLSTFGSQKTTPAVGSSSWPRRFVVHIVYKNNGANKALYLMGTRPASANSILYLTPPCADSAQLIWLQRSSSNQMTLTMPYNSTTFDVQNVNVYSWNLTAMPS